LPSTGSLGIATAGKLAQSAAAAEGLSHNSSANSPQAAQPPAGPGVAPPLQTLLSISSSLTHTRTLSHPNPNHSARSSTTAPSWTSALPPTASSTSRTCPSPSCRRWPTSWPPARPSPSASSPASPARGGWPYPCCPRAPPMAAAGVAAAGANGRRRAAAATPAATPRPVARSRHAARRAAAAAPAATPARPSPSKRVRNSRAPSLASPRPTVSAWSWRARAACLACCLPTCAMAPSPPRARRSPSASWPSTPAAAAST